jgi:hypothetical protein
MEYLNTGGLFVSTVRKTDKSPDYFGSIKVDRSYLKFLMESTDTDGIEIKLGGWKKESKTGNRFISLSVDTYVKPDQAKPQTTESPKDEWEI